MAPKVAEANADPAAAAPAKKDSGKLVMIVGIVAVLIAAQVVITWMLMPKPVDPNAAAAAGATKEAAPPENRGEEHADEGNVDAIEVKIGDFNCTNSTAAPGVVVQVDFKLSAVTTSGQQAALSDQLKTHDARVRQIVNKIVRSSNLEDLNDPNLGTLKRLIREEVNRLLRKSLISEVVISDIRTMEQ